MCPHAKNLHYAFICFAIFIYEVLIIRQNTIYDTVLFIDAARVQSFQITFKLLIRRWVLKWILLNYCK